MTVPVMCGGQRECGAAAAVGGQRPQHGGPERSALCRVGPRTDLVQQHQGASICLSPQRLHISVAPLTIAARCMMLRVITVCSALHMGGARRPLPVGTRTDLLHSTRAV